VRRAQAAVREGGAIGLAEEEPLVGQRGNEGLRRQVGAPVEVDEDEEVLSLADKKEN